MTMLPNVDFAYIDDRKITEYLLASDHPKGRDKAAFFNSFGFKLAEWSLLRDALLEHARSNDATGLPPTDFATKYLVTGPLTCPDGRMPRVRAVWIRYWRKQSALRFRGPRLEVRPMLEEHAMVAVTRDLPAQQLRRGAIGTIVHVYPGAAAYEVEFDRIDGQDVPLATLGSADIRLATENEIAQLDQTPHAAK